MKKILFVTIAVVIGFFLYENFAKKSVTTEYITKKAYKGTLVKKVEATGEIYATELVNVGAQVSGQIQKLYVKLGDNVKQGDMIAKIDDKTQKNTVDNRKAQLLIYEAQLNSAKVAYDIAKTQYEREKILFDKDATSKQEYESAKNAYANTKARIKELQSSINQAKISLNTAEIDLDYTKITAPRDGVVVSVLVEEGQTVNANQTTPTIVYIADLSKVNLKMQIAEGDITKIGVGTKVEYSILSEPDIKFQAKITSIDPGLTTLSDGKYASSSISNTSASSASAVYYYAQSVVDNSDGILRIGMTTQNSLFVTEVNDAIIIPTIAIKKDGKNSYINVLNDDKSVSRRDIKLGISDGLNTQVLQGVDEGENVITSQVNSDEIAKMVKSERRGPM